MLLSSELDFWKDFQRNFFNLEIIGKSSTYRLRRVQRSQPCDVDDIGRDRVWILLLWLPVELEGCVRDHLDVKVDGRRGK